MSYFISSILAVLFLADCSRGATTIKELTKDTDVPQPPPPESIPVAVVKPLPAPSIPDIQTRLLNTFSSYVGIKESPIGSNNGPMINKFNASCGLDPFEHAPWCASVTNYGYELNGLVGRGAYSPSWYTTKREVSQNSVQKADIGLVYFPSKGRYAHTIAAVEKITWSAGRVVEVQTLEGNTNAQGSREGDQFARRIRPADTLTFVRWWK